jgi:hypothetical protein
MKFLIYGFLLFLVSAFSFDLNAQDPVVDKTTGEIFPRDAAIEHEGKKYQLQITGETTRKKLFIKVYSIAHYLEKKANENNTNKINAIMSDDNAKQFTLKWVYDVNSQKIQNAYEDSFHKVFTELEYDQLKNEINQFLHFFNQDAHKGDEYILRWFPGGYLEVMVNGQKKGSISNPKFVKGLWNIWLGPKSIVNRNELISL